MLKKSNEQAPGHFGVLLGDDDGVVNTRVLRFPNNFEPLLLNEGKKKVQDCLIKNF